MNSNFLICTVHRIFGVSDKGWLDRGVCRRHGREIVVSEYLKRRYYFQIQTYVKSKSRRFCDHEKYNHLRDTTYE
jgi:hypothetical protein